MNTVMQIKKQLEENQKARRILQTLPVSKVLQLNSVSYLEVQVLNQSQIIVNLGAEYYGERTIEQTNQILERKKLLYMTTLTKQAKETEQRNANELKDKDNDRNNDAIPKEVNIENSLINSNHCLKETNVNDEGITINIGEDIFEIQEKYQEQAASVQIDQDTLLIQIQEAFFNENIPEYNRLNKLLSGQVSSKNNELIEQIEKVSQPKSQLIADNKQTQSQPPVRISKFKQERLNQKK